MRSNVRSELKINALASYLPFVTNLVRPFIVVPLIIQKAGNEALSAWFLGLSILGLISFLETALLHTLSRAIVNAEKEGDNNSFAETMGAAIAITAVIGILLGLICVLIAYFSSYLFRFANEFEQEFTVFLFLIASVFPVRAITLPFQAYIYAKNKARLIYSTSAIVAFAAIAPMYFVLEVGGGVIELGYILVGQYTVELILTIILFRAQKKDAPRIAMPTGLGALVGTGSYNRSLFIISLCGVIAFQADTIIAGITLDTFAVACIGVAIRLYTIPQQLALQITHPVFFAANRLHTDGSNAALQSLFKIGTRVSMFILFLFMMPLVIFGDDVIRIWVGIEYQQTAYIALLIFMSHFVLNINHNIAIQMLRGQGKVRELKYFVLKITGLNLLLSIILVNWLGIYGLAIGTSVPFFILEWKFMSYILSRYNVSASEYWKEIILPIYFPALCFVVFLYAIKIIWIEQIDILELFVFSALGALFYSGAILLFKSNRVVLASLKG